MEKQDQINLYPAITGNTVTILHGKAPEQPDITPKKVNIAGNITAPAEFFTKRSGFHDLNKSFVVYSMNETYIMLVLDEENPYSKHIEGRLLVNPELSALQINNFEAGYDRH